MVTPPRLVSAILILLGLTLAGCTSGVLGSGGSGQVTCDSDFSFLLPADWKIVSHSALEPDNKSELICVVFYHFDSNGGSRQPVGGAVVRQDRDRPHDLHVYPLSLPGGMYLGEHQVFAREVEVLSGAKDLEVVVEDKTPENIIVGASIFKWRQADKSEESGYDLLGFFPGDGGVMVEPDKVTVLVRHSGTRSQFADRQIYRPRDNQSYFQKGSFKLVPPDTTGWTALCVPEDPAMSEYSEKVVLAFYEDITDTNKLKGMMAPDAWEAFEKRDPVFGCLVDAQRTGVLVTNMDLGQALAVPTHTENNNVVVTATVTVTSTCLITFGGSSSKKDVKLVWQVRWDKYDDKGNEKDKWMLLKPSIKP